MKPIDIERAMLIEPEHILAITLYGEARGEPIEGKVGVGNVILNRFKDKRWPKTIAEVCIQPKQFSCWNENDPNFPKLHEKLWMLKGIDKDMAWRECLWVAGGILRSYLIDNTKGANHYHTISVNPSWDDKMELTAVIGRHQFFRG